MTPKPRSGSIGWNDCAGAAGWFDDFIARKRSSHQPAWTLGLARRATVGPRPAVQVGLSRSTSANGSRLS